MDYERSVVGRVSAKVEMRIPTGPEWRERRWVEERRERQC